MQPQLRIAFWSTPRTVSTACLRAFAGRPDTTGVDEPLYGWFLHHSGRPHPMREEVLSALGSKWEPVVEEVLLGSCPTPVQFVKHMCHHLVGDVSLDWVSDPSMRHVFLLRDPAEQIPSMHRDLGVIDEAGLGYDRQLELFQSAASPVVIDSRDLLNDSERIMRLLCVELGLDYDPCMVEWSPGRHESYGVWAPYWYTNVETSTGFQPWKAKEAPFPEEFQDLLNWAEPMYRQMHAVRLGA